MEPLDNRKSGKLDQVFLWVLSTSNYLYFTLLGFPVTSAEKGPHSVTRVGWILGYICLFFLNPYDFIDKILQRLTVQKKNVTHCSIIIPQTVIPFSIQILIFLLYLSLSAVLFAPPLSLPCCHQSPEDPIFSFSSSSAPNAHHLLREASLPSLPSCRTCQDQSRAGPECTPKSTLTGPESTGTMSLM